MTNAAIDTRARRRWTSANDDDMPSSAVSHAVLHRPVVARDVHSQASMFGNVDRRPRENPGRMCLRQVSRAECLGSAETAARQCPVGSASHAARTGRARVDHAVHRDVWRGRASCTSLQSMTRTMPVLWNGRFVRRTDKGNSFSERSSMGDGISRSGRCLRGKSRVSARHTERRKLMCN